MEKNVVKEFDKLISDETIVNINRKKKYNDILDELEEENENLASNMPWNSTEQATEITVDDAAKYSKNRLELFGNTEQDNTKITYKCDGTETGDYYLTYNNIDYYFTMPTITEGDILVFDTTDLKLYLADTEITTESTGTGTNLTFISSPSPDYPQDIHVVKGHNVIDFKTDLFVMANNLQNGKTFRTGTDIMENDQYCAICLDYLPIITGKQYDMETQNGIRWLRLNFYDKNKTLLRWTYFDANTNYSFTPKENEAYIRFSMRREDYNTLQILYIARTLELDLPEGIELCKIGDYQDYLYKENGNWYIQKNTKKAILGKPTTGNLDTDYTYNYFSYRGEPSEIYPGTNIICSHFIGAYNVSDMRTKAQYNNSIYWGSSATFVRVDKFNTVEEYINALSADDITIIGRAKTPTTTQITDTTLISQLDKIYEHLKLVKGTNNITVTAEDLAPYIKLTYMQDLPSKLDKLEAMVIENS